MTDETKKKISDSKKGKKLSLEHRKKLSELRKGKNNSFFGKHHTLEARKNMSEKHTGRKLSEDHKEKIRISNSGENNYLFGKHLPKDTIDKIIRTKKLKGIIGGMTGKSHSPETRAKLRKFHLGRKLSQKTKDKMSQAQKGEKHHAWKGGKSLQKYSIGWDNIFRDNIRKRDNYICQECGVHQNDLSGRLRKLDVHHIDYDKFNINPENLITLCRRCHARTNKNRDYWKNYFSSNKL